MILFSKVAEILVSGPRGGSVSAKQHVVLVVSSSIGEVAEGNDAKRWEAVRSECPLREILELALEFRKPVVVGR